MPSDKATKAKERSKNRELKRKAKLIKRRNRHIYLEEIKKQSRIKKYNSQKNGKEKIKTKTKMLSKKL